MSIRSRDNNILARLFTQNYRIGLNVFQLTVIISNCGPTAVSGGLRWSTSKQNDTRPHSQCVRDDAYSYPPSLPTSPIVYARRSPLFAPGYDAVILRTKVGTLTGPAEPVSCIKRTTVPLTKKVHKVKPCQARAGNSSQHSHGPPCWRCQGKRVSLARPWCLWPPAAAPGYHVSDAAEALPPDTAGFKKSDAGE